MRRIVFIPVLLSLAACSGPAASPDVSVASSTPETIAGSSEFVTTRPAEVDPQFVLFLEGFSAFGLLGDGAADVIGAFEEAFGDPTADSGWIEDHGCGFDGPMRTVTWIEPGVRLTFVDGPSDFGVGAHLAGYSTVLPVDPPWELAGGVRRGMSLDQVLGAYPDAELIVGGVLDVIRLRPGFESYASLDAAGEIREFFAGADYCG